MVSYSIKDLEKITGIKAHTIRIWEKRYGIVKPSRTQTNIRYYSDENLRHLMNVAILNKYGHKISNIQGMSPAEISESVLNLSQQDLDNDYQVDNLVMSMVEIDEQRFDKIISSSIIKNGIDYTFENLLNKFLHKVGILWQIGVINPAQEHFITQLIRQKFILAIDAKHEIRENAKSFLLFLPENEYHELGLLYLNLLIRKAGHKVFYLGQNVPVRNLKSIFELHTIDYMLTSITSNQSKEALLVLFSEINELYGDKKILVGGYLIKEAGVQLPGNFKAFAAITEFTEFLQQIA
ncbi:MAG: MerR family transcriptional regulator [Bacteroidota bacterium]